MTVRMRKFVTAEGKTLIVPWWEHFLLRKKRAIVRSKVSLPSVSKVHGSVAQFGARSYGRNTTFG